MSCQFLDAWNACDLSPWLFTCWIPHQKNHIKEKKKESEKKGETERHRCEKLKNFRSQKKQNADTDTGGAPVDVIDEAGHERAGGVGGFKLRSMYANASPLSCERQEKTGDKGSGRPEGVGKVSSCGTDGETRGQVYRRIRDGLDSQADSPNGEENVGSK